MIQFSFEADDDLSVYPPHMPVNKRSCCSAALCLRASRQEQSVNPSLPLFVPSLPAQRLLRLDQVRSFQNRLNNLIYQ
jgi:hypothetical protein